MKLTAVDPGPLPMLVEKLFSRDCQAKMNGAANSKLKKYIGTEPIGTGKDKITESPNKHIFG